MSSLLSWLRDSGRELGWASRQFTTAFTGHYERLAELQPVYGQLRGVVDLLIAAAFLHRHDAYAQCRWRPEGLISEDAFAIETQPQPRRAACVANALWKGNRMLCFASRGVTIEPIRALDQAQLGQEDLDQRRAETTPTELDAWWWD